MSQDRYECQKCHKELSQNMKSCPDCGGIGTHIKVVTDESTLRESLKLKVRDKSGKITRKSVSRDKVSLHGREAKETIDIDKVENRKRHHVEEKNEKGNWTPVHDEDEPLRKSHKKQK